MLVASASLSVNQEWPPDSLREGLDRRTGTRTPTSWPLAQHSPFQNRQSHQSWLPPS